LSDQLVEHRGVNYHPQRVVCVTIVPPYTKSEYEIDKAVEAKVVRLVNGLGENCRVCKFQWFVATDEPCGGITQDLGHEGVENVFVFSVLVGTDWQLWTKSQSVTDDWEFEGLAAFLQLHLDNGD
jgi:hypothetical protein